MEAEWAGLIHQFLNIESSKPWFLLKMQDPAWVQCQRGTGPMYQTRGPVPLLQGAQFRNLFSLDL